MAQANIELNGRTGLIALVVIVALVLWRMATLGTSFDPALNEAIRAELRNDMGGNLQQALASANSSNAQDIARLTALANADNIQVLSTHISKPLLSFSSNQKAVVKVAYALPEQNSQEEYWEFSHALVGGWTYRRRSTALSYYLNFF